MKLDWKGVAVIAGVALVIYFTTRRDVQKIAESVGTAVNVTSPKNIVYKTVSAGTSAGSFGSALYDLFHPGEKG